MSSSLGLLGGYGSDSSSNSDNSYETITPNKDHNTHDITSCSKINDNNKKTTTFQETTATTSSHETEKGRSYFDVDSEREEESSDEEEIDSPLNSADNTSVPKRHSSSNTDSSLPLPQLNKIHSGLAEALPGSVFSNPYKEVEDIKRSVLEHHVTLAPSEVEKKDQPKFRRGGGRGRRFQMRDDKSDEFFNDQDSSIKTKKFNRKKVGVAPGLVPSSKYMKLHEQQQAKERPWTLKK